MPISRNQFMRMLDDNEEPLAVKAKVGLILRQHYENNDRRRSRPICKRGTWLSAQHSEEFNRLHRLCNKLIDRGVPQGVSVCTHIERLKNKYHERNPNAVRRGPSQRVRFQSREQIRLVERAAAASGQSFNAWATQVLTLRAKQVLSECGGNHHSAA